MQIAFEKLAVQMLEALVDEERGRTVRLGPTGPFRGELSTAEGTTRIQGHVEVVTLLDALWTFDSGMHIRLSGPVLFRGLQGRIDMGPRGTRLALEAERVELPMFEVTSKTWTLRLEDVVLVEAELVTGAGASTSIRATDAKAEDARFDGADLDVSVAALHLQEVTFGSGFFRAEGLSGRTVRVDAELPPRRPGAGAGPTREQLEALDGLDGSISASVETGMVVDAGWPVVGRRVAKHQFALSLRDGRLAAPEVEDGLASLEDAVLDLVFDERGLALEAGFPSVASHTVVRWPLTKEERAAAQGDASMSLSRWLTPELPLRDDGGEGSWLRLDRLSLTSGRGALTYRGQGTWSVGSGHLRIGTEAGAPFERLVLDFGLEVEPAGEGRLDFTAEKVHLGARDLPVGKLVLDLHRLDIVSLDEGGLRFVGREPQRVGATGRVVSLRKLALRWP